MRDPKAWLLAAAATISALGLTACQTGLGLTPVEIRFANESGQSFDALEVGFGESAAEFRDLAPGDVTEYREFRGAYHYGFVKVTAGGEEYLLVPIDFVGEEPLDPGRYTYRLTLGSPGFGGIEGTMRRDR